MKTLLVILCLVCSGCGPSFSGLPEIPKIEHSKDLREIFSSLSESDIKYFIDKAFENRNEVGDLKFIEVTSAIMDSSKGMDESKPFIKALLSHEKPSLKEIIEEAELSSDEKLKTAAKSAMEKYKEVEKILTNDQ